MGTFNMTEAQHVYLVFTRLLKTPALNRDDAWGLLRVIGEPGRAVTLGCCGRPGRNRALYVDKLFCG